MCRTDLETRLKEARTLLKKAVRLTALTGAGISAESGVPTFRGEQGLWKKYRAEELATYEAFLRQPELVWEWYNWRRDLIAEKRPNPGHQALAALEKGRDFTLITQNVDGLHLLAGSRNVLEIHGSIWRVRCTACGRGRDDRSVPLPYPPLCPDCRGLLRPDVVWFGEALDAGLWEKALDKVVSGQLMLVVGTSALVQPAASLAWEAKRAGVLVMEINPERTPFSAEADLVLSGSAGVILPALVSETGSTP
ncbi:MAG: NAD-dependent deacylase [Thermodesulfobacteriota bacterium]